MINQTKWSIDQTHSEIAFKVKHLMIAHVKGTFKKFDASIYTVEQDFNTVQIDLWIDAASITTGDETRDAHLMSEDFLDVKSHKQITFVSDSIEKTDSVSNYDIWGSLTIKGITKKTRLHAQFGGIVKDQLGNTKAGFTIVLEINRSEWGLTWNNILETGGLLLSDEVSISCELELSNTLQKDMEMKLEQKAYSS